MDRWGWRPRHALAATGVIAGLLFGAAPAAGKTYEPNKTTDHAVNGCTKADCTLREAVIAAGKRKGADKVRLRARTYKLTRTAGGSEEAYGDIDTKGPLRIEHLRSGRATIDASALYPALFPTSDGRALENVGGGKLTLSRIVIKNSNAGPGYGGAIQTSGDLSLIRSETRDTTAQSGGSIAIAGPHKLTISRSKLLNFAAVNQGGGQNPDGGAIFADDDGSKIDISRSELFDGARADAGAAHDGGVMWIRSDLSIDRTTLRGDAGGSGGSILAYVVREPSHVTINRSDFLFNSAGDHGGAINLLYSQATIRNSTFELSSAGTGGGAIAGSGSPGNEPTLLAVNDTIARNEANGYGSAIDWYSGGDVILDRSTIAGNTADYDNNSGVEAGAINSIAPLSGGFSVKNSLFALNETHDPTPAPGTNPDCNGTFFSGGANVFDHAASVNSGCAGFSPPGDFQSNYGSGMVRQDGVDIPSVADNGGPTPTVGLPEGTAALDTFKCTGTDQRGFTRSLGDGPKCDSGAYERITCHNQAVNVVGTNKGERLNGTDGADGILALGGNDRVFGYGGADSVCAGNGNDRVSGSSGGDRMYGEAGRDRLIGGPDYDFANGGPGKDTCVAEKKISC